MPKGEMATTRQAGVSFDWPRDADGEPMAMITMQVSELIGLPNYSNVTVGPASVTRFVCDTEDEVNKGLKKTATDVETIVASERELVLQAVSAS